MPARSGSTTYVPGKGKLPKRKKKLPPKAEVAGPYRSESSDPEIRKEATAREHRKAPTTVAGAKRQNKTARKKEAAALKNLREGLRDIAPPPTPQSELERAKAYGELPSARLRKGHPKAYKKAESAALKALAKKEGLKEDPAAELVISTLATAGLGAGAKLAGKGAAALGAKLGSTEATLGEQAAEKGAKTLIKKALGKRAAKIKSVPKRVRSAPKRARKAASTKEGRRAAGKSAGRTAVRHPIKTGVPAAAALPPGVLPSGIDPGERARAFLQGTAAAAINHPGKTLETTAQGALGAFTFPLALGGAAVKSAAEGSTEPLEKEASELYAGTKRMVEGLASGDPRKVEETTLQESGLIPFIPVPHVVRRAKGTKLYEDSVRGRVRHGVEGKRAKTREKRKAAQTKAAAEGKFTPKRKAKKVRQAVPDTERPGESYVLRRTGTRREKQRSRHYMAREAARMENEGEMAGKLAAESVAKPLRKSKGTNQKEQNFGEALRIVVKHGLPQDEASGIAFVKRLHEGWKKNEPGEIPQTGVHLDRHSTEFILAHPEIFKDKHFWQAVERFDKRSAEVGTSPRNRFLAQVHNLINPILKEEGRSRILTPEEMVPDGTVKIMRRLVPDREVHWSRSAVLDYVKDLKAKGASNAGLRAVAKEIEGSLVDEKGNALMRPPEHGGAERGVTTTQAIAWTPEMENAFVKAAQRENKRLGLRDPAPYVADRLPSSVKGTDRLPDFGKQIPLRKVWPSEGKAARSGNALSDFESLIFHSLEAPLQRGALVKGLDRVFTKASREVNGKRFLARAEVEKAINTGNWPEGTIPVRPQALKALLEGENVADPIEFRNALQEAVEAGQRIASSAGEQLRGEMLAAKGLKGEKFAPMDAAMIQELMGHLEGPSRFSRGVGRATNFSTQAILNSPAFELAQFAQEGIPMAAALGRNLANIPKALLALKEIAKHPPEMQAQIRAVVGSSAGLRGAPSSKALRSEGFMNPIRAAGHKTPWRHVWEIVNGNKLSRFDRARAGRFRETAALAKLEGDFKRAEKGFHIWRSSANNLFKDMDRAVADTRGMSAAERIAYVTSHPELGDRLQKSMNGMAGNWNSFTVFEKEIAPFAIFYSFQRYSVLWTLYHFPLDHPVVATALGMFGAANAQELKKAAAEEGATPSILDYTKPVVAGETVLPAGQRFFGGLGSVQQAIAEGKPTQALGGLSPAIGIPLEAIGGKNSYTGADIGENGWLYAARQIANLSPFLRFIGAPDIGSEKSAASQAYGVQDPLRTQRSLFDPYIGQTTKQFAKEKRLSKEFGTKYGEGDIPSAFDAKIVQDLLYGNNGKPKPELLPEVLRKIHAAERASDFISKAEKPFLPPSEEFGELREKLLQAVEDAWQTGPGSKKREEEDPFGLPSTSASSLREQFGLPSTSSADLKKQFGIE